MPFRRNIKDIILLETVWGNLYDPEVNSPLYTDDGEFVQPDYWSMLKTDNPWDVNPALPEYCIGPFDYEDMCAFDELKTEFPDEPFETWFWLTRTVAAA